MNLNRFSHPNSLIQLTWYLISTLHILPSPVLSHCPDHAVSLVSCLYAFSNRNFLHKFLSIFCLLINPSFSTLFMVSFQNFFSFYFLDLFTHTFRSQNSIKIYIKNKDIILARGKWQSSLLLTFSGAILRPLLSISALLLPIFSFQTPFPLHHGPNSLQLHCVPLLAFHQVLERLSDFLVLLHKFLECLFNGT